MELRFRLLLNIFLLGTIFCRVAKMQTEIGSGPKKYCGSQIGQALSVVCRGQYNTLKRTERFPRPTQWDNMYSDMPDPGTAELSYPYQTKSEATSLMGGKRRKKRWGVYNECCEKSCTPDELQSYCAAPSKRRRR